MLLTKVLGSYTYALVLLVEGRQPVTPVGGAGCGARGFGLVSRALGRPWVTVRVPLRGLCLKWLDGGEASEAKASRWGAG